MSVPADYADAVLRRAREPMEPRNFSPNWDDKPYRSKVYPGVTRIPLPTPADGPGGTVGDALTGNAGDREFDLDALSAMLLDSYGLLARRVRLTGNEDSALAPWHGFANWGRGTASGGGLYSVEIYWVAGPGGPLLPGVYHYSPTHHALDRLLVGDVTDRVRAAAAGPPAVAGSDQFLLLGVKFWKNAFKYNTFCYHVVTMDIGTTLGTWDLWCSATGRRIKPVLWFDEPDLNALLGLDPVEESVLAVVPLRWGGRPSASTAAAPPTPGSTAAVTARERERSRTVLRFPLIEAVHEACMADRGPAPDGHRLDGVVPSIAGGPDAVPLPAPPAGMLAMPMEDALRTRRSSFGGFVAAPPLSRADLAGVLALGAVKGRVPSEVDGPALTRMSVFVNHVEGIGPGAYHYDPGAGSLHPVRLEPVGRFLQWTYFLQNYNLEQAAAVIAVLGSPAAVIEALGDRGYRLLNAEVGAVAQALYVGAAAARTGCGAVLGFDNSSIAEHLGIAGTGEWPLLLIMVGPERPAAPDFDYRLD